MWTELLLIDRFGPSGKRSFCRILYKARAIFILLADDLFVLSKMELKSTDVAQPIAEKRNSHPSRESSSSDRFFIGMTNRRTEVGSAHLFLIHILSLMRTV